MKSSHFKFVKTLSIFGSLFSTLFLFSNTSYSETAQKVTLRADTWCPYNCKPDSKDPGLMVEVAYKAFGKANVDYQISPWKRAISDAREGLIDGIIGAAPTEAPDFYMASALSRSINCFYTKSDSKWIYSGHDSIKSQRMGTILGYAYPDSIVAYTKENAQNVEISGDGVLTNLLKMVSIGRIDITPDDGNVLSYTLESNPDLKKLVKESGCMEDDSDIMTISIAFSPKYQQKSLKLVRKLNETIRDMIQTGEMQKLAAKYKMKPWW